MSKLISSVSNAKALAGASAILIVPPVQVGRPDSLTAQRIQVGLVLSQMLGEQAAAAYLSRQAVDAKVTRRVLSSGGRRRASDDASHL
ncbi:hypothetical protein [Massilia sp. TSP1-1-2]|uniref:hypothetical protein n=1 Tax=unclassified Massilia TaxID=2609279 RepID=UPI003CEFFBD1